MILHRAALPHLWRIAPGLALAGALTGLAAAQTASHPGAVATVATLNSAWNIENTELHRSVAFAKKAEEEGYEPVASLFRAAAAAERVHVRNLAVAMKKLGYEPDAVADSVAVGSTAENLQSEIAVHAAYSEKTLPELVLSAQHGGFRAAMESLNDANRAEASLVKYYRAALAELNSSKGKPKQTYYVCKECGYMTTHLNFNVCKVCYHFRERHQAVS